MDLAVGARRLKSLCPVLGSLDSSLKNRALFAIAAALRLHAGEISAANEKDRRNAQASGVAEPLLARLKFQGEKVDASAAGLEAVAALPDPVGRTLTARELDQGLILHQITCPLGVVAMIFESRPDALVQIAGLALKSGNGIILKGGSEARESNRYLAGLVHDAAVSVGIPEGWLYLAETRDDVSTLLQLNGFIDLIIPRGSNSFVQYVMKNTTIPVLGHADGICHVYADCKLDVEQAIPVIVDSKAQYAAVCNAVETLLVHADVAEELLPKLKEAMDAKGVVLRGCDRTRKVLSGIETASEVDWATEYLDYILAVKIVDTLTEAIEHINRWGSHHTDAILTRDQASAKTFLDLVDSADVFWNCSTRFADGFRFGLGAEVGVGTGKIHARGPVGLEGLVIYKWKLYGTGQVVADYVGPNAKAFTHRELTLFDKTLEGGKEAFGSPK